MAAKIKKIGICDTMFARADMGGLAERTIAGYAPKGTKIERVTVPGIKDLPVAAKKLIEEKNAALSLRLGWLAALKLTKCARTKPRRG